MEFSGTQAFGEEESEAKTCCFGRCIKSSRHDEETDKQRERGICGQICGLCCNNMVMTLVCAPCGYKFRRKADKVACTLCSLGVASLLVALLVPIILDIAIQKGIHDSVVVDSPDASSFPTWQTNIAGEGDDVDVYFNVYFFDLQNPREVLQGQKPIVLEKGPYSYSEYFLKFDIHWSDDGDTVTFNTQKYYVFNQETSGPGLYENDNLTVSYAVALGFQYLLGKLPVDANSFLDGLINQTLYPIEQQLKELAEDYRGPKKQLILDIEAGLETLQEDLEKFIDEAPPGMGAMKILLCDSGPGGPTPFWVTQPRSAYFGWLNDPVMQSIANILAAVDPSAYWTTAVPGAYINYTTVEDTRRRRTPDTMKTGKTNLKETNRYVRWGNRTYNWVCVAPGDSPQSEDFVEGEMFPACSQFQHDWTPDEAHDHGYRVPWASDYANRVRGTDGQIYGGYVDTDKVQIFSYDIYRSAYFPLIDPDVENWHNIKLRRYSFNPADNYNVETRPTQAQWNQYALNGLTNMTFEGAPVFGSMPHFLYGDPKLLEAVEGVTPGVPDQHETQLDIEPNTGVMPQVHKRIQMNYWIEETILPNMTKSAIENAHTLCEMLALLPDNATSFNGTCDTWNNLFTCMAVPTHWNIQNGGVYLPYAWLDETTVFPKRYADDIQSGILDNQQFAADVRTWGLVTAGVLFALLFGFLFSQRMAADEVKALRERLGEEGSTAPLLVQRSPMAPPAEGAAGSGEQMRKDPNHNGNL